MVGWSKGVLPSTAPPQNVFPLKEEMAPVVAAEDENAAERPQIGTKAVALIVGPDLGRHVGRRPRPARRVVVALRILREQGRQPEVRQFPEEAAAPLTDSKNVVWLEVPVEDRLGPEVVEVAQGEGEMSKASPDAVLLEAHGVRLQRLPHLALFDISISDIDCRYIDTFKKYRHRYRYRQGDFGKYRY